MNVHSINVLAVTCNTDGTLSDHLWRSAQLTVPARFFYRIQVQDLGERGTAWTHTGSSLATA